MLHVVGLHRTVLGLNAKAPDLISAVPLVSGGSLGLNWATSLGFRVLIGKRQELDGLKSFLCRSPRRWLSFYPSESLDRWPRQRTKQATVLVWCSVDRQVGQTHQTWLLRATAPCVKSFKHAKDDSPWFSLSVPRGSPSKAGRKG